MPSDVHPPECLIFLPLLDQDPGDRVGDLRAELAEASSPPFVIAADSGYRTAFDLGFTPSVLIGDLDSISAQDVADARSRGIRVIEYDTDKDSSDFGLALDLADAHCAGATLVIGSLAGRPDQAYGILSELTSPERTGLAVAAFLDGWIHYVVRSGQPLQFASTAGDTVSLWAMHGLVSGATTSGLRWDLDDELFKPGGSHGLSNVATGGEVRCRVETGVMLVQHAGKGSSAAPQQPRSQQSRE